MKDTLNNPIDVPPRRLQTSNSCLQDALEERDRFLERHLHLRSYQMEIDRILDKSGDCRGRMEVLGTLIQGKLFEMQKELYTLTRILQESIRSN